MNPRRLMSNYQHIVKLVDDMDHPQQKSVSQTAQELFDAGIDRVDGYLDDLSQLIAALNVFRETRSQVYFAAGVAYALVAASHMRVNKYEASGLHAAQEWLYSKRS